MSETKTFSVRLNETERDFVSKAVTKACEFYDVQNKGNALYKLTEQWLGFISTEGGPTQEVLTPIPDQLEEMCELAFLQKIIEPKKSVKLWHCLKNQSPDGKGKPILMADGRDSQSIANLCEACKTGFVWREQRARAKRLLPL